MNSAEMWIRQRDVGRPRRLHHLPRFPFPHPRPRRARSGERIDDRVRVRGVFPVGILRELDGGEQARCLNKGGEHDKKLNILSWKREQLLHRYV